jgi:hypothetical protein
MITLTLPRSALQSAAHSRGSTANKGPQPCVYERGNIPHSHSSTLLQLKYTLLSHTFDVPKQKLVALLRPDTAAAPLLLQSSTHVQILAILHTQATVSCTRTEPST